MRFCDSSARFQLQQPTLIEPGKSLSHFFVLDSPGQTALSDETDAPAGGVVGSREGVLHGCKKIFLAELSFSRARGKARSLANNESDVRKRAARKVLRQLDRIER